MFVTKIKSVLAAALVVAALAGAAGLTYQTQAAAQPSGSHKVRAGTSAEKASPVSSSPAEEISSKTVQKDPKVLTPEQAIKRMPKENVTVQFRVASVGRPNPNYRGYLYLINYIQLRDGGKFTANLFDKARTLEPSEGFEGKMVRVTGRVEPSGGDMFRMVVRDVNNIEIVKE